MPLRSASATSSLLKVSDDRIEQVSYCMALGLDKEISDLLSSTWRELLSNPLAKTMRIIDFEEFLKQKIPDYREQEHNQRRLERLLTLGEDVQEVDFELFVGVMNLNAEWEV